MTDKQSANSSAEEQGFILTSRPQHSASNRWLIALAVAIFLLLALAVVFVLPNYVGSGQNQTPVPVVTLNDSKNATPLAESPWQDAQIAKHRREAQEVLSQLLSKQKTLEDMQIASWNSEGFTQAMAQAAEADVLYRQREFERAQQVYLNVSTQFDALIAQSNEVFEQSMAQGNQALVDLDAETAIIEFTLASAIKADSAEAQTGFKRASVLSDIVSLVQKSGAAAKKQDFKAAKDALVQAFDLDNDSPYVRAHIETLNQQITDFNFNNAMSAGYEALQQQDYEQSITQFNRAKKLKPEADEVTQALALASNKKDSAQLSTLFLQAKQLEAEENWQQANDIFQQALAVDSTLVTAKVGDIRTAARAHLDSLLKKTIAEPDRLASDAVYNEAQQLLQQARKIANPGKVLSQQIDDLSQALMQSRVEITVRFESDNLTQVRLKHFGSLGNFSEKNLVLIPGRYTAIGTRDGYRDVVQDFSIEAGIASTTVVVQCLEKVVN